MKSDLYPEALIIEPMKINKIPEGKEHMFPSLCASGEYFAELKKDGYWYMYERTNNYAYLFSRNVSKDTGVLTEKGANVPHIMSALKCLPAGTILVGEIYYPGGSSKTVTPIMGSLPDKAIDRQRGEYGWIHYYLHDILRYNGVDLTSYGASVRYDILKLVVEKYQLTKKAWYYSQGEGAPQGFIELAERVDDNIQEAVAAALDAGEEGMVLKKKAAPYTPGKRPAWDTIKIKKTDTCDAICIGTCEPTKLYEGKEIDTWQFWEDDMPVTKAYALGWKTAIEIGAYNDNGEIVSIGTISSGLTDEMKEGLSKNPASYVGKVVELAGMEKNNEDHTLRHFHLKRFRDDKDPKECTIKSIF